MSRFGICVERLARCVVLAALLSGTAHGRVAPDAEYRIAKKPEWIAAVAPAEPSDAQLGQAVDGVAYTLVDDQLRVLPTERTRYLRFASRALNAKGVDGIANITIEFDPSWQRLTLHGVDVVRAGRVLPRLASARKQVIQREKELAARIFDGSKTLSLTLEDVRVGDTVDYSFSLTGRNPVFDGLEFGQFDLSYNVPVARRHARLLVTPDRPLRLQRFNGAPEAARLRQGDLLAYAWNATDVLGLVVEDQAPGWYRPHARVEWTEFRDWAAVADWAAPLYRTPETLGAELAAEVARIAAASPRPVDRLLAALRFAQREIRYLGVETGRNSHAPNPPDLVYRRRFGDCKDKALLLLSLLDRLGIEAHAALVNTELRRGIADGMPDPGAFDHVLVRARIDGRDYWIDPTRTEQESRLAALHQPDFDLALVVAPGTRALASMRDAARAPSQRRVKVLYDASQGFDKPVPYTVETVYEGDAAERQRDSLSSNALADVQKNYLEFYANSYRGIRVAAPMVVEDDKVGNRITIREHYEIADIAVTADGKHTVQIATPDVDDLLKDPERTIRRAPLALRYPLEVRQSTELRLPEEWTITPMDARVDDPAFQFRRTVRKDDLRVLIEDAYSVRRDEVRADDMPRYVASLSKAREELGYYLSWTDVGNRPPLLERMNWPVVAVLLLALSLFAALAAVAWRYDPPARPGPPDPALTGIAGWMLLLAIGLCLTPLRIAIDMAEIVDATSLDHWARVATPGGENFHPLWGPLLLFELIGNLFFLVLSVLLLVLLFGKRSSFPRFAMACILGNLAFVLSDAWLSTQVPGITQEPGDWALVARSSISGLLWSAYLWRSRRVGSTFVRRRHAPAVQADDAPAPPLPA
jgi:transglutaminase-like putative cysteine protease